MDQSTGTKLFWPLQCREVAVSVGWTVVVFNVLKHPWIEM